MKCEKAFAWLLDHINLLHYVTSIYLNLLCFFFHHSSIHRTNWIKAKFIFYVYHGEHWTAFLQTSLENTTLWWWLLYLNIINWKLMGFSIVWPIQNKFFSFLNSFFFFCMSEYVKANLLLWICSYMLFNLVTMDFQFARL